MICVDVWVCVCELVCVFECLCVQLSGCVCGCVGEWGYFLKKYISDTAKKLTRRKVRLCPMMPPRYDAEIFPLDVPPLIWPLDMSPRQVPGSLYHASSLLHYAQIYLPISWPQNRELGCGNKQYFTPMREIFLKGDYVSGYVGVFEFRHVTDVFSRIPSFR